MNESSALRLGELIISACVYMQIELQYARLRMPGKLQWFNEISDRMVSHHRMVFYESS